MGLTVARVTLPLGFLVAPLQARAFAGVALERIVRGVDDTTTSPSSMERLVAETLDDPALKLLFWVPPGQYVDAAGEPLQVVDARSGRGRTLVGRGAEPVIAIEHDEALDDEPELMQAVGSALLLVLEKRTVQDELGRSSQRIATARQVERRRIERDLHDSAQQRLIAVRMQVDLARESTNDRAMLDTLGEVGDDIGEALIELRSIAHGTYPQRLAQDGLAAAVTDAARHFGGHVQVEAVDVDRYLEEVEVAVFFCILEAIQNVAKTCRARSRGASGDPRRPRRVPALRGDRQRSGL